MNLPGPDALAAALARYEKRQVPPLPGRTNHRHAGILLPLRWQGDTIQLVATRRTSHLRDHAGEVVFPGGKPDPTDADLTATALREAHEELGIDRAQVLGSLSAIPLFTSDFRLFPTVARIDDAPLQPHPAEVAEVYELDLRRVLEGEHILAIAWPDEAGFPPSPVFEMGGAHNPLMYGGTAICLFELLEVLSRLCGQPLPPFDTTRWTWDMTVMGPRRLPVAQSTES